MGDVVYQSSVRVRKVLGVHREATLPAGVSVAFGVHGPIKTHFKLDHEPDLPLPVDYIVAATGG